MIDMNLDIEKSVGRLMRQGRQRLEAAGIENSFGETRTVMMHILNCTATELFLKEEDYADEELTDKFDKIIEKRCERYPLQYILGAAAFMGHDFKCREGVLIPRFDTENLVEAAVNAACRRTGPVRVLDLCTGTGCIGISYYLERKRQGFHDIVVLSDISDDALQLSKENAESLHAEVDIVKSDIFASLDPNSDRFDILLSNPPYISTEECDKLMTEVRDHEPRLALDGGEDGLDFYRKIIFRMGSYLSDGADILLEIGYDQYDAVATLLKEAGCTGIRLIKDLSGLDRVVACKW